MGKLLRSQLASYKTRGSGKYLFTTEKGSLLGNFRRRFQIACKRASIKELCFHDFRHTAITNMLKAGINISVIVAIPGHRKMAMFRRYNKIDLNDGREAMKKLEIYLSGHEQTIEPYAL